MLGTLHHPKQRLRGFVGPLGGEPLVFDDAPLGPRLRTCDRLLLIAPRVHQRRQLVKRKHDVGAELMLDSHRDLRGESVHRTIDVRLEGHPIVIDRGEPILAGRDDVVGLDAFGIHRQRLLEAGAERKHLEATGVGERWAGPVHERPKTPGRIDDVGAGLEVEVVGIRQQCLGAKVGHRLGQHRFHRRASADRDEGGRPDLPVGGADRAAAPEPVR